ncbi:MFS transporter [Nostoc sp. FACHB-152]|uniref:MFS transporter n=1 Tax=unclassified Nostoc TaxID=2593658 RepID=UPI0016828E4D|nr:MULTISPECIES: MFS transporter [unclassified Nostoc]MBD2447188.1 MFS transporter [Nostoc sp. FACHB-152]MBD2469134.1 MFS transporter [Nostoc sp. FACHB-145]
MHHLRYPWRAFQSRNFRVYFVGQSISVLGNFMAQTGLIWLVYSITNSSTWLGAVYFANQFSTFVLLPVAGVLVDRWNRYYTLVVTQTLLMFVSLLTAVLVLSNSIQVWQLFMLMFCSGCINAFDIPTRQSLIVQFVDDSQDISNVLALNSSIYGIASMIAPSIAGVVIASAGTGICFLIDGFSFLAVLAGLLFMHLPQKYPITKPQPLRQGLQEGIHYVISSHPIRVVLVLIALMSMLVTGTTTLLPVIAKDILHGNAVTLGFLTSAAALGALLATVYVSTQIYVKRLSQLLWLGSILSGCALAIVAISQTLWISLIAMFVGGLGFLLQQIAGNALVQIVVHEEKRGRVSSLYIMTYTGTGIIGSLLMGVLSTHIGISQTIFTAGLLCFLVAVWFFFQLSRFNTYKNN